VSPSCVASVVFIWGVGGVLRGGGGGGVKRPGREGDHSPPSIVMVKSDWSLPLPPTCLHDVHSDKFTFFIIRC